MSNKKFSQINGGVSVPYVRATDQIMAVRGGATDQLLSGVQEINPPPQLAAGTLAITAAMSGRPILLNLSTGSIASLPAATGSGNRYRALVSTSLASGAHKVLTNSSADFIIGTVTGGQSGAAASTFNSPAATNHSIQMPFAGTQPSGGSAGDWFEFADIAVNLWHCSGSFTAGTAPTTPFSAATS